MPLRNLARGQLRRRWGAAGFALSIALAWSCAPPAPEAPASSAQAERGDRAALAALVEKYVRSINDLDLDLAGEVWLQSDRVSFIYPRGRQTGWEAIAENFYGKIMGGLFSKRSLKPRDIAVNLFGGAAVVEFNWTFDATRRKDEAEVQETGRETQVYHRGGDGRWRLVHIHYSRLPAAAAE